MMIFGAFFHGLKFGFEYIPELGTKGTWVFEFLFFRLIIVNGIPNESGDVQDRD